MLNKSEISRPNRKGGQSLWSCYHGELGFIITFGQLIVLYVEMGYSGGARSESQMTRDVAIAADSDEVGEYSYMPIDELKGMRKDLWSPWVLGIDY